MNRKWLLGAALMILTLLALMTSAGAETLLSGSCGENVAYTLDSEGLLMITGAGPMADYEYEGAPWYAQRESIRTVRIEAGVSTIGSCAFRKCTGVTEVSIAGTVTEIGSSAFYGCQRLTEVLLPEGMTTLRSYAFGGCTGLSGILVPEGVTHLGDEVFSGCTSLVSAVLPASLPTLPYNSFSGCQSLVTVTLPEGVGRIGSGAFSGCRSLSTLTLPQSIHTIEGYAFSGCAGLQSIILPQGLTKVADDTFRNCVSLSSVNLPEGVTDIGVEAFYGCSSLRAVVIPDSVARMDKKAFYGCTELVTVYFYGTDMPLMGEDVFALPPTICCLKGSAADAWAKEQGWEVSYLDAADPDRVISCTLPEVFRLQKGATARVVPVIFPLLDSTPALQWTSDAPEILSVSGGLLTAHAVGECTVTVTCGEVSDTMLVTVYALLTDFRLSAEEMWIVAGQPAQLDVLRLTPSDARAFFTYASGDEALLTVDDAGRIQTRGTGDVTIAVTSDNGIRRECLVHLCDPVEAIAFTEAAVELLAGQSHALTARVTAGSQTLTNRLVTFASSDEAIVTVEPDGRITAVAPGKATITAADDSGEITASVTVTVRSATSAVLPANLVAIEAEAFLGAGFDVAILPEGCRSIGARAFAGNAALRKVYIPASVKEIAEDAFDSCPWVTFVCAEDSAAAAYADRHGIAWAAEE